MPAVLRRNKKWSSHEEMYSELLLYIPYITESEELSEDPEKCAEIYEENKTVIVENKKCIYPFTQDENLVQDIIESENKTKDIYDLIDGATRQEDSDDAENLDQIDDSPLPDEPRVPGYQASGGKFKPIIPDEFQIMKKNARMLSFEQRIIFDRIISYCLDKRMARKCPTFKPEPPQIITHGGGGCGKTFVINLVAKMAVHILKEAGWDPLNPIVLLLGPTGRAAALIGGNTMHKSLDCRFGTTYNLLDPSKISDFEQYFKDLELVIIDEMSMVSSDSLYHIHHRLIDILKYKESFGGKAVMFNGDLLQLFPVKGAPIFDPPRNKQNRAFASIVKIDDSGKKKRGLWNQMEVVTLKANFRQGNGSEFLECLNEVRVCEDIKDLPQRHIDLLESRRIENHPNKDLSMASSVFFRNVDVQEYNASKLDGLSGQLYESEAILKYAPGCKPEITPHGTVGDTSYMKTLRFKIGAKFVLVTNIDVTQSLFNGSMGKIIGVTSKDNKITCIIVSFDDPDAGADLKKQLEGEALEFAKQNGCPMFVHKQRYTKKFKGQYKEGEVFQFPLQLAWAFTAHKLQGTTIPPGEDFIVNGYKRMPKSMGYVMLSRLSKIENLFIDKSFDFKKHLICNPKALRAKQKLDERDMSSSYKNMKLDIYFVNAGSMGLKAHIEDIKKDMYATRARYCCFAETSIASSEEAQQFFIDGFNLVETSGGKGKGVCAYVKNTEKCNIPFKVNSQFCQALSVLMDGNGIQLTIIYLKSGALMSEVKLCMEQLFRSVEMVKKIDNHIIVGDFNFDAKETNALTKMFVQDLRLKQLVQRPTHREGRTIDHLYVSPSINCDLKFINHYYTDHTSFCVNIN